MRTAPRFSARPAYPAGATTFLHLHRAFVRRPRGRRVAAAAAALALGLTAAWVMVLPLVAWAWGHALAALAAALGHPDAVVMTVYSVFGVLPVGVPHLEWTATDPSRLTWMVTAVATLVAFAATWALPERFTPLKYLARAICLVQGISLFYFALWPGQFPYTLGAYGAGMMATGLAITSAVPVVLGFTYYVHDVGLGRKVLFTGLALAHSAILVPVLYAAHTLVVAAGSLLFLPVLYLLAGIPLHVMTLVSLYAWGMSWPGRAASSAR